MGVNHPIDSEIRASRPIVNVLFYMSQLAGATAGGTEQHLSFLLRNLPSDSIQSHLAINRNTNYYDYDLYPVEPFYTHIKSLSDPKQTYKCIKDLRQYINEHNIDVIHAFFQESELLSLLVKPFCRNLKVIISRRDLGYFHTRITFPLAMAATFLADSVSVNCDAIVQYVNNKECSPKDKIKLIYNPLVQKRVSDPEDGTIALEKFGIRKDQKVVGIVAGYRDVKDYPTFLRAAEIVLASHPDTCFLIIGGGVEKESIAIDQAIREAQQHFNVIAAGQIENPLPLVREFAVGVLCSTSEGLSNTLIEYAAAGIPTVATDVGGNPEIVAHGVTGYLVPPRSPEALAQRIIEILDNDDLRRRLGDNAMKDAENRFHEQTIINQYVDYYRTITGK
jgi:glycosyltransferase involved in cell wall biosynthesis